MRILLLLTLIAISATADAQLLTGVTTSTTASGGIGGQTFACLLDGSLSLCVGGIQ